MGEALQKKPSQEGRFLFNCHDRGMKAYLDRRWNTWGPPGWRREYEERAGVMEEKRTPPELARTMMELLGCPCTYFAPMWDDDPLLECLQMNLEPEGEYMASRRSRRRRGTDRSGMERYPAPSPTTRWSARYPAQWPGRSR